MLFNNPGYMTRGFDAEVPPEIQMMISDCLDAARHTLAEMDYLQVFTLDRISLNNVSFQRIIHTQEYPSYEKTVLLNLPEDQIITTKVFVIDDGDYHTFLLALEY